MFQSIKYLHSTYHYKANLYHYQYEITDSNFVYISGVAAWAARAAALAPMAVSVIKEYENRKYDHQEIVKNLFLLNMFLLKEWSFKDLNHILEYQHKYLIKENFPETNFNQKYYNNLMLHTKKMIVLY